VFAWARTRRIAEIHIWGKGEVEDQLFQPKNDHLLFAYFGISLQIRRRSIRTSLRAKLAMKRKCERLLGDTKGGFRRRVLLRDPTDDRYPYKPTRSDKVTHEPIHWKVAHFIQHEPIGVVIEHRSFYAYVADDGASWDCVDKADDGELTTSDDPWSDKKQHDPERDNIWRVWLEIPARSRALFNLCEIIKYEDIIDIDEHGDRILPDPHIYLENIRSRMKFEVIRYVEPFRESVYPDPNKRVKFFPDQFPDSRPNFPEDRLISEP
jgi:hypothetical protein